MKFWQNNRLDGTFEAPVEQLVAQFRVSIWWAADLDIESAVRGFLTDAAGPVRAVWDDEADLVELCVAALVAGWTPMPHLGGPPRPDTALFAGRS